MDDADRAQQTIEQDLESAIAAARGIKPASRDRCRDCGDELDGVRREFGTCIACAQRRELAVRLGILRATRSRFGRR